MTSTQVFGWAMFKLTLRSMFNFCKQIIEQTPKQANPADSPLIKLSKWISLKSLCSRKQAQQFIKLGLVRINGKRVYENLMVPEQSNMKAFTPEGIRQERPVTKLWSINKPRGYICSHRDPQKRPSVYQLLPPFFKNYGHIVSVGRLDFNSQGILLLTNDVKLKNLLQNPQANLVRVYRVKVHGRVSPQKLESMSKPMMIKGKQYGPLRVQVDRSLTTNVWLTVSMKTGKNRQIRRIMQKCDLQVNKLIRTQYGKYKLNKMKHGEIQQIPIAFGLQKRLKIQKARQLSKSKFLIQVDIREKAIETATQQQKKRLESQSQKPQIDSKQNSIGQKNKKQNRRNDDSDQQESTEDD